ncbi:MAG: endolytic transglycosylase MltG [Oscillospiraceae bacterium]|nr:endolytic transglycosylase MltG [Oscillospiraceae bacterium]
MTEEDRAQTKVIPTDEARREIHLHAETGAEPEPEMPEIRKPSVLTKIIKVFVYLAIVLALSFAASYFAWICACDVFALSKPDREVEIVIEETDTIDDVIAMMVEEDLVDYEWLFRIYCSVANAEDKVSVGTYTLNNVYDYNALINGMRATSATRETVTVMIPEGYTNAQIFELLEENGVCSVEELENAVASYMFDYNYLQGLPYGATNRLEGYLFPDTYEFYVDDSPERVLSKFLDNFGWKFSEELQADIDELNAILREQMITNGFTEEEIAANEIDMHDVVIVASLIERETGGTAESSSISSVIYNRMTSKIYPLLQIDASLRYGIDKWDEALTSQDLALDNPYNTHKHPGLPAGPISNPGLDSIRAALYPRSTEYYFYALNPATGLHRFASNYYEHQDNIEEMNQD